MKKISNFVAGDYVNIRHPAGHLMHAEIVYIYAYDGCINVRVLENNEIVYRMDAKYLIHTMSASVIDEMMCL